MAISRKFEDINMNGDARLMHLINSLFGGYGNSKQVVGIFGDLLTAKRLPLFSTSFAYPANTKTIKTDIVGGGVIDYDLNMLRISTTSTQGSSACIRTKRQLRYIAGRDAEAMATCVFTTGVAGTYQRIGLIDNEDGLWIGMEGESFAVGRRKDGEAQDEIILRKDFNGDKLDGSGDSGFVIDVTKMNVFRINFGYLGTADIRYQVLATVNGVTQFITFHTIDRKNKFSETHIRLPYLPLCMQISNGNTTAELSMKTGSIYAGIFDGTDEDRAARLFSASAIATTTTAVTDKLIACFHNKATFHGIENHIESNLLYFTCGVEGNKPVIVSLYRLPLQTNATGTWLNVDSDNSTFEYSTDTILDLSNKELLISFALGKSDSIQESLDKLYISALPDDYIGVTFTTTSSTDVNVTFRWEELF